MISDDNGVEVLIEHQSEKQIRIQHENSYSSKKKRLLIIPPNARIVTNQGEWIPLIVGMTSEP